MAGIMIGDLPDLGAVTDSVALVAQGTISGRILAPALRSYLGAPPAPFNAVAYGADPTGSMDSTDAIAAAIAAAKASGRGAVSLPAGHYLVRGGVLALDGSELALLGAPGATWLRCTTATGDVIRIGADGTWLRDIVLSGVSFLPVVSQTSGAQIKICSGQNVRISDVTITGNHAAVPQPYDGIRMEAIGGLLSGVFVSRFWIEAYSHAAFNIGQVSVGDTTTPPTDIYISQGTIGGNGPGTEAGTSMALYCASGLYVSDVDATGGAELGIRFMPASPHQTVNGAYFSNVFSDSVKGHCWDFVGTGIIASISLSNCWGGGSTTGAGLATEAGSNINDLRINSSTFHVNHAQGIALASTISHNIAITNCAVYQNSWGSAGTHDGILVMPGVREFSITDCHVGVGGLFAGAGALQNVGINVAAGSSDGYVISGNRGQGNIGALVVDAGTGLNKYVAGNVASPLW